MTYHNKGGLTTQRKSTKLFSNVKQSGLNFATVLFSPHKLRVAPAACGNTKRNSVNSPRRSFFLFFFFICAPNFTALQHELWAVMSKSCNELIGRQPNGSPWPHSACVTTNQKGEGTRMQHFQSQVTSGSKYLIHQL